MENNVWTMKTALLFLLLGSVMGGVIGIIIGEKITPQEITNIRVYKNGTLSVYDRIYLTKQLPEDLDGIYKVEDKDRIVFLWIKDYTHSLYLNVVVLEK